MKPHTILLLLALALVTKAQVLVDNFDPRVPRPGATLPASIDPYGVTRPLPPSIDPLGISYRPAHAGAVLPALWDPLGASRPGGLPFALDPVGYTRTTDSTWGGRGYSAYGGSLGAAYDSYLARPSGFLTGVGGPPIYPDPNAAVPLYTGRVHGTYPPAPTIAMPVMPVSTVPVAPIASVAPVAPVTYSVPPVSIPVNPAPSYNPPPVATSLPPVSFGNGGLASNLPIGGSLPFGNGGLGSNVASVPAVGGGNLQIGSGSRPLNPGTGVSGGAASSDATALLFSGGISSGLGWRNRRGQLGRLNLDPGQYYSPKVEAISERKTAFLPAFDFWNPLTWINPKYSSQTLFSMPQGSRESQEFTYQQLKKALLPANLFFGNIRAQFEAWDNEPKKHQKSKDYVVLTTKKPNKNR